MSEMNNMNEITNVDHEIHSTVGGGGGVAGGLKRAPSDTTVNISQPQIHWERSQSDVNLSQLKVSAAVSLLGSCIDEEVVISNAPVGATSKSKGLVSEQALVYWNLPEAVEGEQDLDNLTTDLNPLQAQYLSSETTTTKNDENSLISDIENASFIMETGTTGKLMDINGDVPLIKNHFIGGGGAGNTITMNSDCDNGGYSGIISMANTNLIANTTAADTAASVPHPISIPSTEEAKFGALDHHGGGSIVMEPYVDASRSMPSDINLSGLGLCTDTANNPSGSLNLDVPCPDILLSGDLTPSSFATFPSVNLLQRHSLSFIPPNLDSPINHMNENAMIIKQNQIIDTTTATTTTSPSLADSILLNQHHHYHYQQHHNNPTGQLTIFASDVQSVMIHRDFLLKFACDPFFVLTDNSSSSMDEIYTGCERTWQKLECCVSSLDRAWQTPHVGRDLASTMCNLTRDQGLLYVVSHLSVAVLHTLCPPPSTIQQPILDERGLLLLRHSAHMLSQILTEENCQELISIKYQPNLRVRQYLLENPTPKVTQTTTTIAGVNESTTTTTKTSENSNEPVYLVNHLIQCAWAVRHDVEWSRDFIAILQALLKHSAQSCDLVVENGGLHTLTFACRSSDFIVLRQTALALTNLSLYASGTQVLQTMTTLGVAHWLFPLAMQNDPVVQYYACLCIAVLWTLATTPSVINNINVTTAMTTTTSDVAATPSTPTFNEVNKESWRCSTDSSGVAQSLAQAVQQSGTLRLVWPFIRHNNPRDFSQSDPFHLQGRSKSWLLRLLPVLACDQDEVQALAVFHFAMEARIKVSQRRASLFQEIGAIPILHSIALGAHYLAAQFAVEALTCLGETTPLILTPEVVKWGDEEIHLWLERIGFQHLSPTFTENRVDGDLLLKLNEETLRDDLGVKNGLLRKRFLRELVRLKNGCSYACVDSSGLSHWLRTHVGSQYVQYTYGFISAGVDRLTLPYLLSSSSADTILARDCGIQNGLHRARLLTVLRACLQQSSSYYYSSSSSGGSGRKSSSSNKEQSLSGKKSKERISFWGELDELNAVDVYIAYQRSTSCTLASLLKVHLQLRGYHVFLDMERICAGQYPSILINTIQKAKNFLLILSTNSLDYCDNDSSTWRDLLHREIALAFGSKCGIIVVMDHFHWPTADKLPSDMKTLLTCNSVEWLHENQDSCVDLIEKFLRRHETFGLAH